MSFDYAAMAATATRLITDFGVSATLYKKSYAGEAYDADVSTTSSTVTAARTENLAWNNETGADVRKTTIYIAADAAAPEMGDRLLFDGVTYTFSRVEKIAPAGIVVAYKTHASTT